MTALSPAGRREAIARMAENELDILVVGGGVVGGGVGGGAADATGVELTGLEFALAPAELAAETT